MRYLPITTPDFFRSRLDQMIDMRHLLVVLAHRLPCDPAPLVRFRRLLGEEGLEQLLKASIEPAIGHSKVVHRMDNCSMWGALVYALHALFCTARDLICWRLRAIAREGLAAAFLCGDTAWRPPEVALGLVGGSTDLYGGIARDQPGTWI